MQAGAHPGRHRQGVRIELGLRQPLNAGVAHYRRDPVVAAVPYQRVCTSRLCHCNQRQVLLCQIGSGRIVAGFPLTANRCS